ncbi:MAG: bifunctional ADP-heptose synthase [Bacteroidia bacterium]|nr:bifunctional ADP-heptose synthase [Bacteroidia bacterium]
MNSLDPSSFLRLCQQQRILVVGDLMVDRYLWGNIDRISPEAPVPVVDVVREEERLGGAANVAINLAAMGAAVEVIGVCGEDDQANVLTELLKHHGFSDAGLIREEGRRTTFKTRVLGHKQQVLRIDRETTTPIKLATGVLLRQAYAKRLDSCNAVILQDYDKGLFSQELISDLIQQARQVGKPVFVDPKFRNFFSYGGCTLFKPNWRELAGAMGYEANTRPGVDGLLSIIKSLRKQMPHEQTLVTLSADGMLWANDAGEYKHLKGHPRDVSDVSGAGDTVLSVVALAMTCGLDPISAGTYANLAGGLVCEESGVVPINPERLKAEALRLADMA